MKLLVLTTSYPRYEGDSTVNFVGEAVAQLRGRGVDVDVVSPATFPHYGIAYGSGIVGNLRRDPWRAAMLPAMFWNFRRAARRLAPRGRPDPRALASERGSRGDLRAAVRRPALGHRRRARQEGEAACP